MCSCLTISKMIMYWMTHRNFSVSHNLYVGAGIHSDIRPVVIGVLISWVTALGHELTDSI
jgi:hypothetical protein